MTARLTIVLLVICGLLMLSASANAWIGREGLGLGKLGAAGSQGSNGVPPVSTCANGNLLLDYSDSCQLMSQMVGN